MFGGCSLHDLRHRFVSSALESDAGLAIVQALSRHIDPATMACYDHRPGNAKLDPQSLSMSRSPQRGHDAVREDYHSSELAEVRHAACLCHQSRPSCG